MEENTSRNSQERSKQSLKDFNYEDLNKQLDHLTNSMKEYNQALQMMRVRCSEQMLEMATSFDPEIREAIKSLDTQVEKLSNVIDPRKTEVKN